MKKFLFVILFSVLVLPLSAQVKSGTISVSARENVVNKLPKDVAYVFPDFVDMTLNYLDGRFSKGRLNVRLLDNFILYIDTKGDTLVLSNPAQVKNLVHNDTIYRVVSNSVVKVLSEDDSRQLAQRVRLKLSEESADAGYSSLPPTSTAVSSSVRSYDPSRNIDTKTEYSYRHEVDYVLIDGDKVYPARLSSFNRLFPDRKKAIKAYVRDNALDLETASGLTALFDFCAGR